MAIISANICGQTVEEVLINQKDEDQYKDYKNKVPTGKFPALETKEGFLFESSALAKHFGRVSPTSNFNGSNNHEAALVDQWIDFALSTI